AFEGLATMDKLQDAEQRPAFTAQLIEDARNDQFLHAKVGKDIPAGISGGQRSDVTADHAVPEVPFYGTRVLRDIPLAEVFDALDLDELFRLQWGGRGSGPEFDAMVKREFAPTLARLKDSRSEERRVGKECRPR